ncbi:MAG: Wzt carbohydrate-binding domain-containing protein, partial [Deinococcota bacterium]
RRRTPGAREDVGKARRIGSREVEITEVRLTDSIGLAVSEIGSGEPLRVELDYVAHTPLPGVIFGVSLSREDGLICYDLDTASAGVAVPLHAGPGRVVLELGRVDLIGGQYHVNVGVYEQEWSYAYDYHWQAYPLTVRAQLGDKGIVRAPSSWKVLGRPQETIG